MQSFCFELALYQASEAEKLCEKLCVWMGDLEGKGSLLGGVIHPCLKHWASAASGIGGCRAVQAL